MSSNNLADRLTSAKNSLDNYEDSVSFINFHGNDDLRIGDSNVRYVKLNNLQDAPKEWNFYRPLSDGKFTELLESIEKNGLLVPIVIWEIDNNPSNPKYMILSGHNRKKGYEVLKKLTGNAKYDEILASIKYKDELTPEEAREIIIDTNWVQRQLSPIEKAKSVIEKYIILQSKTRYESGRNEYGEGRLRNVVAEEYKITGRQVERYRSLQNLIPEIQELAHNNIISLTPAYEIAILNQDLQRWIFDNHVDKIISKYTRKLRSDMSLEEVKNIYEDVRVEKCKLNINIPKAAYEKYNTLSSENKANLEKEILNLINSYVI